MRASGTSRPLTILHVLAPATVGGLESVVHALAVGHRAAGHNVHVLAVLPGDSGDHPFVDALHASQVPVTALKLRGRDYARERAAVAERCRELLVDVVHTHGYRPDVVDAGVARRLGIPTVTTVHGPTTGGRWRGHLYLWLQGLAHRRFDAVIAVSRVLADTLASRGIAPERLHLVPNGHVRIAAPLARTEARGRLGIPTGAFHLGWIGRLSHEKGADVLLDALARLRHLPVSASVLGDGPEQAALHAQAKRLGLEDRIIWHGVVSNAAQYASAFDAVVLSSRTEGTPIVLLEAMAAGTPVVATSVGGVPDVLSPREGALVAAVDPQALATAIEAIYLEPGVAAQRAARARARLDEKFGARAWLDAHVRIYRSLVARRGSQSDLALVTG